MFKPKVGMSIIEMTLDTVTALSIISKMLFDSKFSGCKLQQTSTVLRSYSGHTLKPLGKFGTKASIDNRYHNSKCVENIVCTARDSV